jgi:hypothetical protein
MIDYTKILEMFYSTSQWSVNGDSYDGIVWLSSDQKPTQAEMDAQWPLCEDNIAKNDCKLKATQLLYATDWTTIPDVANPSDANPYLTNQREFITWRSEIRQLAVNPVANPVWPTQPTPQWGNKQ